MKKEQSNTQLPLDFSINQTSPAELEKNLQPFAPNLTLVKNLQLDKPTDNDLKVRNRNLQRIVEYSKSLSW
jgi:hypothetical protein